MESFILESIKFSIAIAVFSSSALSQSGWSWENPLPQGSTLRAVQYVTQETAYVGGDAGALLRSIDGGNSWEVLNLMSYNCIDLFFVSGTTGFVTSGGRLLKTTDAGETWSSLTGTFNGRFAFPSRTIGFEYDNYPGGLENPPSVKLNKTTDGGATWNMIFFLWSANFYDIFFADTSLGYILGDDGGFWRTTNGGFNWSRSEIRRYGPIAIAFSDRTRGVAVGAYFSDAFVYQTSDSGSTWTWRFNRTMPLLNDVAFWDTGNGIAVGSGGNILRTTDGGVTWADCVSGTNLSLFRVSCFGGGLAVAVGDAGLILRSTNHGLTWNPYGSSVSYLDLRSVSLPSQGFAIAVGQNGLILKREGKPPTWVQQQSNTTATLNGVSFMNPDTGIAVGTSGKIVRTTNSGTGWNEQPPVTTSSLNSVKLRSDGVALAVGSSGAIRRTSDGGQSWFASNSGTNLNLYSVCWASGQTWYASGDVVLKTTDDGATWGIALSSCRDCFGVAFANRDTGLVTSWGATTSHAYLAALRTTNGGGSWNVVGLMTSLNAIPKLRGICVLDNHISIAVGDKGMSWMSTDYGSTWHRQSIPTGSTLLGVSFLDAESGVTVGVNGTILSTNSGGVVDVPVVQPLKPNGLLLLQNYPNPFNPSTRIGFSVPDNGTRSRPPGADGQIADCGLVTIKVFDVLGREVATLVNEEMEAGNYERSFDGSGLASGLYFYRLRAGSISETKKLILLR